MRTIQEIIQAAEGFASGRIAVAAAHDADEGFVAGGMSLTTLGCFVLVPILMLVLRVMGLI